VAVAGTAAYVLAILCDLIKSIGEFRRE
jgi:hypothetical protein